MDLEFTTSQVLGTIFYTVCVFVAGSWLGPKFWGWISDKMPWNKYR